MTEACREFTPAAVGIYLAGEGGDAWVRRFEDHLASCPDNLIIRLSAPMVDQAAPESWPHTSTVVTSGRTCPAPDQGNQCKDCRACWDKDVKNIAYGEH